MDYSIIVTSLVFFGVLLGLIQDQFPRVFVFPAALVLLIFSGIIQPEQALQGFSNQSLYIIAFLFIFAQGARKSEVLENLGKIVFFSKPNPSVKGSLGKILPMATVFSSFFNNTPIVVVLAPLIQKWTQRLSMPVSKFLIPLSYATILGGTCTLIGTSTNLIVHGFMIEKTGEGLGFFQLAWVGVPVAIIGLIYLIFFAPSLLPNRKGLLDQLDEKPQDYLVEMVVQQGTAIPGKTLDEAGLRSMKGLMLSQIKRRGRILDQPEGMEKLEGDDVLTFMGTREGLLELTQIPGLSPLSENSLGPEGVGEKGVFFSHLAEAVVSEAFPGLGLSIENLSFRAHYDSEVLAVHRNGVKLTGHLGSIRLRAGDTLVLATRDYRSLKGRTRDFYFVNTLGDRRPEKPLAPWGILLALGVMVLGGVFGPWISSLLPINLGFFHFSLLGVLILLFSRTLGWRDLGKGVNMPLLFTLGSALSLGFALETTGFIPALMEIVSPWIEGLGLHGAVFIFLLITMLLTETVTNNAAAALMLPFGWSLAQSTGMDPLPLFMAIAIGASASFLTPMGYQTNLVIQGIGGYKSADYFRSGIFLSLLILTAGTLILPLMAG